MENLHVISFHLTDMEPNHRQTATEVLMLFQMVWERRDSVGEDADRRMLSIIEKFTVPANITIHSWVERTDGGGGFGLVETDDPKALAVGPALFSPFGAFHTYPVLQHDEAVAELAEAVALRESIS